MSGLILKVFGTQIDEAIGAISLSAAARSGYCSCAQAAPIPERREYARQKATKPFTVVNYLLFFLIYIF
jgi:hypothetical protein